MYYYIDLLINLFVKNFERLILETNLKIGIQKYRLSLICYIIKLLKYVNQRNGNRDNCLASSNANLDCIHYISTLYI